jgi:hypothetical protein
MQKIFQDIDMSKVTLVSALFNIKREEMDGRTWEEYLKWFDITLKLKCPMVLFVSGDLLSFVEKRRKDIPTKVIVQTIEEIPYYYLKDKMDIILQSDDYRNKMEVLDRIECNYSLYSIIQYSKFKWIEKAIQNNDFDNELFFWIDAGASRFFDGFDLGKEFPGVAANKELNKLGEKVLIQQNMESYSDLVSSNALDKSYFYDARSFVCGTFFGMHKNIHSKILGEIENIVFNDMISKNNLNNEQITLGYLVKNKPELFEVFYRNNWKQIELFTELTK